MIAAKKMKSGSERGGRGMADERRQDYSHFTFRVSWAGLGEAAWQAGFREISGLGTENIVAEHAGCRDDGPAPRRIRGVSHTAESIELDRGALVSPGPMKPLIKFGHDCPRVLPKGGLIRGRQPAWAQKPSRSGICGGESCRPS